MGTAVLSHQQQHSGGPWAGDRRRAGPRGRRPELPHGLVPAPLVLRLAAGSPPAPHPGEGQGPTPRLGYFPRCKTAARPAAAFLQLHYAMWDGAIPGPNPKGWGDPGSLSPAPTPLAFLQLLDGFCDTVLHFLVPDRADHRGVFWGANFDAFWELFKKTNTNKQKNSAPNSATSCRLCTSGGKCFYTDSREDTERPQAVS